jgi:hypothetical protein
MRLSYNYSSVSQSVSRSAKVALTDQSSCLEDIRREVIEPLQWVGSSD